MVRNDIEILKEKKQEHCSKLLTAQEVVIEPRFQSISTPLSGREDTTRATRVLSLNIWQKQPSFFLISLCPLLFKNSAEKEKTIFQNLLAVISRLPCLCTGLIEGQVHLLTCPFCCIPAGPIGSVVTP
ncbi:thrombospondin 2/3/4/5 [Sarotherodon galilaeus]